MNAANPLWGASRFTVNSSSDGIGQAGHRRHVKRPVNCAGPGPGIVLEDLDHQGGLVGDDHARLLHPDQVGLAFGLAERAASIDGDIDVIACADRSDRGKGGADL